MHGLGDRNNSVSDMTLYFTYKVRYSRSSQVPRYLPTYLGTRVPRVDTLDTVYLDTYLSRQSGVRCATERAVVAKLN